jgi:hypothetical protein
VSTLPFFYICKKQQFEPAKAKARQNLDHGPMWSIDGGRNRAVECKKQAGDRCWAQLLQPRSNTGWGAHQI